MQDKTTHFGYQEVPAAEKQNRVAEVFDSVAQRYDLMNDFMSLGIHRHWKKFAIERLAIRPGMKILDLASGTGDLVLQMMKPLDAQGEIIMSDINASMLTEGRNKLVNKGVVQPVQFAQINAEKLPFSDNYFDRVSIGFGLRNVTDKQQALNDIWRVLKPGGMAMILEFSKPTLPGLNTFYDAYSFSVLPALGKFIVNDASSYQYLAESIRMHPDQDTLKSMMESAQMEDVCYHNLTGGIVAVHVGHKY